MFDLQGHRGARGLFPENTLHGFARTLALGVTSLELDVGVTRDGVAVVLHDAVLNPDLTRDAAGAWLDGPARIVNALSWAELRAFDVGRIRPGARLETEFASQVAHDGARVPALAEVLALAARHGVRVHAELKTDPRAPELTVSPETMADLVVEAAAAAGALPWLRVRSLDWRGLRHLRRTRPEIPLAWLSDAATEAAPELWWHAPDDPSVDRSTPAAVADAAQVAGRPAWIPVWAPDYRGLTAWRIGEAHALGLRVVPWTVNHQADMALLLSLGVDGLCTDRPDLAREVMAAFGLTPPACANPACANLDQPD
jgi:glycerophosphoryl diester phosphodiesterase